MSKVNPLSPQHTGDFVSTVENNTSKTLGILKKITLRKVLLKLHLYISLWLGAFLVIAGLTGSILVYGHAIDAWLNPELMRVEAGQQKLPMFDLIKIANQVSPIKTPPHHLQLPKNPTDSLIVRYQVPLPQGANPRAMNHHFYEVMVNPYTSEVLGHRDRDDSFVTMMLHIHHNLLAGDTGKLLMGITALLTLILTITGIYLWWPKLGKIKQAFLIKKNASFTRFNFDLHKVVGIYTAVVMFAVALSGTYFNLPMIFRPAVAAFSPLSEMPRNVKSVAAVSNAVSPEHVMSIAQARFPYADIQRVFLPVNAQGSYMVSLRQADEIREKGSTIAWIDQYSGQLLQVRDPKQFNAGDAFINLQLPLHNGEILGTFGKILVLIVGFAPLALMITGVIHWWKKRQAKQFHQTRIHSI